MSSTQESHDVFARELMAELAPVPSPESLSRVRALVSRSRRIGRPGAGKAWRFAGGLAVAAAVAAAAIVMTPQIENAAFARDRAADALVFASDGRITHVVWRATSTGWTEQFGRDPKLDLDQRTDEWYDPAGARSYSTTTNVKDGSLDGASARVGDREARFQNNVRPLTGEPSLMLGTTALPFGSTIGGMTDQVRAEISDGHAKIVGTVEFEGDRCWEVRIDESAVSKKHGWDGPVGDSSVVTVLLGKDDYLIRRYQREFSGHNGNGDFNGSDTVVFERWEKLASADVDARRFSIDAVIKLAPKGTQRVKTVDGAAIN